MRYTSVWFAHSLIYFLDCRYFRFYIVEDNKIYIASFSEGYADLKLAFAHDTKRTVETLRTEEGALRLCQYLEGGRWIRT